MIETIVNSNLDFFSGGGEMGELIRSKDWSKTPLGSPDTWPQSLRTAVSICIASNFPICISWGPHQVQIYNDGYWPITGDMHPKSMGQNFKECWHSAWPVIGQAFEEASLGATRFLETQRIFLDRYGYLEETFFTFSFSPILDESGNVGGLFHPVIDQTQQTLAERRLIILPALANHTVNAINVEEATSLIMDCLKDFELDLPFVLLYSIAADGKEAYLAGSVGVEKDSHLAPSKINIKEHALKSWPFIEVIQNGKVVQVDELAEIFGTFNCGPYPEPPRQALVFPVIIPSAAHNKYFVIAGVSSRRRLDEKYLLFYELLSATITNVLTKAKAYEEEKKKAEALAEIDKAKTVFFSNISHEFRTPLTLMLSPLEELLNQKKNNFSESEKGNIETAHRNAMRLLKLVNTLLDFSRIESGRQQAIFSLVDIVALTKNLASNFRSVIEKADLKLIVKADSIIQPVYVDKQMWEKIVFNLLSNAFKYTLKGNIMVELSAENDFVVLKVKDTGVGIPVKELPKMFERFHRVQNVTGRTHEGTGIGLSLIKELVQMHHGSISVESELNKGSIFIVKIPLGKKHLDRHQISKAENTSEEISSNIYVDEIETLIETDTKQKSKSPSSQEKSALPTVLVVDDNADMREHISHVLLNHFNIITANNGMDALHKINETIPSLVLSDIMMPVMDGIGLLKEIKSNKATANIPVIFLTARAGEESRIEGLETGADDYLVKPFSAKELLSRIKAQIKIEKLRQSLEGNMRNLFLEAPAAISVLRGPQHEYELANEMYLQLIGNRKVLGKSIREVLPELEGQGYFEILDNVYSTGEPFNGNELLAMLDKGNGKLEESYFNFVYQPAHNSEGEIDGILVHGVDVTEQVLARKKIEESEFRYHNMIYTSLSLIAIFKGEDMVIDIANDAILESWGKGKNIIGKSLISIMPEIVEQGFEKILLNVYKTGEPYYAYETPVTLIKNGKPELMHYTFVYQAQCNADGEIEGVAVIASEVTPQVELNKKIKASEEKFRLLVLQAPVAICILRGEDYLIEVVNEKMFEMWDRTLEQALNKPAFEVLPELREQGFKELLDTVYKTGERFVTEELPINLKRNGKLENAFVKFVYEPLREADGTISGVMALAHEITEQVVARKKVEENEKLLEQKVSQRTEQLNEKNIELQKMNKELEAFTYISSHDLQEPLRKIQTLAGRIIANEKEHLSENAKDYFNRMQDAATRMQTLIQDLLAFSRVSTSERKFELTALNKIVDEVKEEFKEVLEEKNGSISIGEVGEVNIIPFQFHQLFYNLISNALKFSKAHVPPRIIIKSKIVKGTNSPFNGKEACHISVTDNGIGFDKQYAERIFGVFQKLHGIDEYAGTGIGLAIVKKIVDNHNGIVTAESELGKGATFNIYLPT
ncbi:MAG: PAS domain-containing protein [Bacteroidia bacterium]|nr:PAS domain-containing protein [Bacteroidia bacterium]